MNRTILVLMLLVSGFAYADGQGSGFFQVHNRSWLSGADRLTAQQISEWTELQKPEVFLDANTLCREIWQSDVEAQIGDWKVIRISTPGSNQPRCELSGNCGAQEWVTLESDFSCKQDKSQ